MFCWCQQRGNLGLANLTDIYWVVRGRTHGPPEGGVYGYAIPTSNVSSIVTDMAKNSALGESVGSRRVHWGYIPAGYKPIVLLCV